MRRLGRGKVVLKGFFSWINRQTEYSHRENMRMIVPKSIGWVLLFLTLAVCVWDMLHWLNRSTYGDEVNLQRALDNQILNLLEGGRRGC